MKLELYQNFSDTKKIGKSLALVETLTPVLLKEKTDILHPVFTFRKFKDGNNWIWKKFNYAKLLWNGFDYSIDDQNYTIERCYFVDKIGLGEGGIIEISCSIDVRETWKSYILSNNYLVARQEHIHNKVMYDSRLAIPMTKSLDSISKDANGNSLVVGDGGDGTIILTVSG